MGSEERARRARTMAVVCTALGMAAMIVAPMARSAPPRMSSSPTPWASARATPASSAIGESTTPSGGVAPPETAGWIEAGDAQAFAYPSRRTAASNLPSVTTVMLHGLCGHPESACAPFVEASTERGWLVCPRGEDACGGGSRWRLRPDEDGKLVEASLGALTREHPDTAHASAPRILVGFSLGGIAAVRIAQAEAEGHGRYAGLVVIASQVHPDGALLEKAGVRRVVLAAGDMDMTSAPLQEDARALNRLGLPTRFVSLGHFGHGYPPDMAELMRAQIAWVAGEN